MLKDDKGGDNDAEGCLTQLTSISMGLYLYLSVYFMANPKVTNIKSTAGKSARDNAAEGRGWLVWSIVTNLTYCST